MGVMYLDSGVFILGCEMMIRTNIDPIIINNNSKIVSSVSEF